MSGQEGGPGQLRALFARDLFTWAVRNQDPSTRIAKVSKDEEWNDSAIGVIKEMLHLVSESSFGASFSFLTETFAELLNAG